MHDCFCFGVIQYVPEHKHVQVERYEIIEINNELLHEQDARRQLSLPREPLWLRGLIRQQVQVRVPHEQPQAQLPRRPCGQGRGREPAGQALLQPREDHAAPLLSGKLIKKRKKKS